MEQLKVGQRFMFNRGNDKEKLYEITTELKPCVRTEGCYEAKSLITGKNAYIFPSELEKYGYTLITKREPYTSEHYGFVYVVGNQNFENNTIPVEVNGIVKDYPMEMKENEIGFRVEDDFIYFSHYMNQDVHVCEEENKSIDNYVLMSNDTARFLGVKEGDSTKDGIVKIDDAIHYGRLIRVNKNAYDLALKDTNQTEVEQEL